MRAEELKANITVHGPLFPEPVQVIVALPMGSSVKLIGKGQDRQKVYERILSPQQLGELTASPEKEPFDGDAFRFRLGVEALRLSLAYEYDPYFSLSIARVDPLPHQLEAVYDYFIKLPRICFLLADDRVPRSLWPIGERLEREPRIRSDIATPASRGCPDSD
jgi:hypothetical protein